MTLTVFFLSSLAYSVEPAVADAEVAISAAKEARAVAIESYRKKLETQKTAIEAKIDAAESACADAKTVWLAMQDPLSATQTELKLVPLSDVSPEIAAANAAYRKELEKLKAGYDAKIAQALKDAKASGAMLDAAEIDVEKIDAELKRLDEQGAKEEVEASRLTCLDRYGNTDMMCEALGPSHLNVETTSGFGNLIGDAPTWSARPTPSRFRKTYLPAEFASCFPREVEVEPLVEQSRFNPGTRRPTR